MESTKRVKLTGRAKKEAYFQRLVGLMTEYQRILIVGITNVGSAQLQTIRKVLRGRAVVLMGKNTLIRRAIRNAKEENPDWLNLLPAVRKNVGLVFTNDNLGAIRDVIMNSRVPAAAKEGAISPVDVVIPKGPTGLIPTQTSFLQALKIQSRIQRGQIDLPQAVHLIKVGDKVGSSEAALLQMLNIKPFFYGLTTEGCYDSGNLFPDAILDITDSTIITKFAQGVSEVAALSLALGIPTIASFPHTVMNGYKNLLAIAVETDFSFPQAELIKQMVENPDAFAVEAPEQETEKVEEVVEEEPEEEEEESDDMGFSFFDDESDE